MPDYDLDLQSIQEARTLAMNARQAQLLWAKASQAEVDRVCAAMAEAAYKASERLGRMAVEETGYGVPIHKMLKNHLSSKLLWEAIKDIKTVGVVRHDEKKRIYEIAWPMGVVAALTPSTNPTSTVMFKTLIAVKGRNAIVAAPHPAAAKCCVETSRVMAEAGEQAGMPKGLVSCMSKISLAGTQELMKHRYVALILATGGSDMVRAAHSVGKPAYGVGPGNVPVYVDRSADLKKAARDIVASKAFDHSVICATEQAVVADKPIAAELAELMKAEGAYFVDDAQAKALANILFPTGHLIDPKTVGKSPQQLAQMAGITVPDWARILVARLKSVGHDEPLSAEKLTTVMGWYESDGWEAGCDRCIQLINYGGRGHSLVIHARNEDVIMAFGLQKPVFRIVVNTWGTLGAPGFTTGVMPSMTLGPGGIGGAVTGDNISVYHMFNVKRLAYELNAPPLEALTEPGATAGPSAAGSSNGSTPEIDEIVRKVLKELSLT